jgi:HD superfamily phosphohydrolase
VVSGKLLRHLADEGIAIRCPVWEQIYLTPEVRSLVDTEDFQRLRHISQLGHVSLVYPGGRHSRFEHSLGVYHLSKKFLLRLIDTGLEVDEEDVKVYVASALLHDIGHYPFSHILEEMRMGPFVHHEERGRRIIVDPDGEIHAVLSEVWGIDPERVANVIDYESEGRVIPERDLLLAQIISGTLDPDKIDYLLRDSLYCGVPFGKAVNRTRLIDSIIYDPTRHRLAITSKGISAIEQLIFTNYQMYRNIYWHHAVRAAVCVFKRVVQEILLHPECGLNEGDFERVTETELVQLLLGELERLEMTGLLKLFRDVLRRRLYKVGRRIFSHEKDRAFTHIFFHLYNNPEERRRKENQLAEIFAEKLGRDLGSLPILIDIPSFNKSLHIDLRVFFGEDIPDGFEDPLHFDDPHVSRIKEYLLDNFEDHAKIFRIFCPADPELQASLRKNVKRFLKSIPMKIHSQGTGAERGTPY